ncbi:MAG: glycosyltransferase, partial [Chloroflexi bacterium]|nr:glycosyltransferase [Chloroflexota bacterium]
MRFSVVIPTLNEASTIEETLRRVQRLAPYELIVADGGSSDGTPDLARPAATVVSARRGRGSQMNAGAAQTTGDVLVFLHADVRLPSNALAAIESALRDPSVAGGYFRVRFGPGPHDVFVAALYELLRRAGGNVVSRDVDLEVYGIGTEQLVALLASFGEVDQKGAAFSVFRVGGLEVAVPRHNSKVSKGHRGFDVTGDPNLSFRDASRRRDLTINAIALDPITGEILDEWGGRDDLERGLLRAVDL